MSAASGKRHVTRNNELRSSVEGRCMCVVGDGFEKHKDTPRSKLPWHKTSEEELVLALPDSTS